MTGSRPPRLIVQTPDTWEVERRYILDVVLSEWLGLEYDFAPGTASNVVIQLPGHKGEVTLPDVLLSTPLEEWLTELSMPIAPFGQVRVDPRQNADEVDRLVSYRSPAGAIPIVFGDPSPQQDAWQEGATGIALFPDVFGSVFFLLTRYEEIVRPFNDRHHRFPASASLGAIEGFLDLPLADRYVDILWMAMHSLWPGLERRASPFRLRLTHDVDELSAVTGHRADAIARAVTGDVLRRHDLGLAARRSRAFFDSWAGRVDRDPYDTFDFLMDTSERHGIRSTFYVMSGNTNPEFDGHYSLSDPHVLQILHRIHDRGHEVGLHASYDAYNSAERMRSEFDALRAACLAAGFDQPRWGVRQHYLRIQIPSTWRIQELAGLEHDSTLGFADQVGFRGGTGREYPLFDLIERRELALRERPLLVMDGTLFDYLGLDLDSAATRTRDIVNACRPHGGDAVLLFHNSAVAGARRRAFYESLVESLVHSS